MFKKKKFNVYFVDSVSGREEMVHLYFQKEKAMPTTRNEL